MDEPYKLKEMFNSKLVASISESLSKAWNGFDHNGFQAAIIPNLEPLELKQRADLIAENLAKFLPDDYPKALDILVRSFGPELGNTSLEGFSSFFYMPHSNFVAYHGLDHFELSMKALYEITKRFTSEFSIRPFLMKHPTQTLEKLHQWTTDPNQHVRRLVSEGSRPRLPWASRLPDFQKDPGPVIELLEKLKADPELYVRRSVANNLNDIAKDHPERVVSLLGDWSKSKDSGTQWIIKHASRTLVKQGHPKMLEILGYSPEVKVGLENLQCTESLKIGEDLVVSFQIRSQENTSANLMVDFLVHFLKKNGKNSPKVFKLAQKSIKPGEVLSFRKKMSLKQRTTRKHYPGKHFVEVQVNGLKRGRIEFDLSSE